MRRLLWQCLVLAALVALYFASDLYEKGRLLNESLPVPVLGWLFWGLLAVAAFDMVVEPVLMFTRLTRLPDVGVTKAAESARRALSRRGDRGDLFWRLNAELSRSLPRKSPEFAERERTLSALLEEYYGSLSPEAAGIIKRYSWRAALCVVFSRNPLVDALLMFLAQVRMAMELMRLYGYRLSPLFNVLCFFWIASNSALSGVFAQAGADSVGELMGELLTDGGLIEEGFQNKLVSRASSCVIEALTSATTVYVTGAVINRKLKGEMKSVTVRDLFRLRREGRAALLSDVPSAAASSVRRIFC